MSTLAKGKVKWFNATKGFGFIVAPGIEADIFVHYSAIQTEGFKEVREGQDVEFEIKKDAKGLRAVNVVPSRMQPKMEAVA